MIPKIIHYCWFGHKRKPRLVKKCIRSWKKYASDFEIVEWNEDNFDLHITKYCEEAYSQKKWAFVSDVARIWAIKKFGGFYLDTDYELKKNVDELCDLDFFAGFENDTQLNFAIFGATKNNDILVKWYDYYENRSFIEKDGLDLLPIGIYFMKKFNYKDLANDKTIFFDKTYFYPNKSNDFCFGIHHFQASWYSKKEKFIKLIGPKWTKVLVRIKRFFSHHE